jgi:hypothetical protein
MSTLKLDTIASRDGTESTDVTNVINGSAKAWVNFNGTGTVAIRESFNVSSITDNAAGDYTVNFTNAMPDANYAPAGIVGFNGGHYLMGLEIKADGGSEFYSTSCRFECRYGPNTTKFDQEFVTITFFR